MSFFKKLFKQKEPEINYSPKVTVEKVADKTDKIKFIADYLTAQDQDFFNNHFCDDDDIYEIAMWIDWREEDENIITYCEDILQTDSLSVETFDADNKRGFEIKIIYKNKETIIPYKGKGADRDTTIKTLNQIIQSEFEIRLCKESLDSDTLCFLPLTNNEWIELETKYPKQVNEKFQKITSETIMFN